MSPQSRLCGRSGVEHVRKFVAYAKLRLNKTAYYPPHGGHRYMVALALYSKCITVAEAILTLLDTGFSDEAYGMTRTLIDIFFTLRYISNKDTDARAKLYFEFVSKDVAGWHDLARDYFPHLQQPMRARTITTAARYRSPHSWSGKTVKDLAMEPDTVDVDDKGKPFVYDFAYRAMFRETSHYVHPTIVALMNHVVRAGCDQFVVHSGRHLKDKSFDAVFNVADYVGQTMMCFYRCMGDPQPDRVGSWAGVVTKHLLRRHR
jgi:Family of unknown function (DUF5677)